MADGRPLAAVGGRLRELAADDTVGGHPVGDAVTRIVVLTDSEYDALTEPDTATLYLVTDAGTGIAAFLGAESLGALAIGDRPVARAYIGADLIADGP